MARYNLHIKPSGSVEGYFVHHCERNLLYNSMSKSQLGSFGLNKPTGSGSPIAALAGEGWEEYVIENYIKPSALHSKTEKKNGKTSYLKYTPEETIEQIVRMENSVRNSKESEYLYQACLAASDSRKRAWFSFDEDLYTGKNADLNVSFTEAYPDLIRADWVEKDGCVVLSVVDIKLAQRMKLSHKVQVTLYVKLLKDAVDEYNKDKPDKDKLIVRINETEGYLWNGGQTQERAFSLKETGDLLEDYFSDVICSVVKKVNKGITKGQETEIKDQVERCVGPQCEWCENCMQCLGELKSNGSTSVIPYLSGYAQEYARQSGAPDTVTNMIGYVANDDNRKLLACNRSWDYILSDGTMLEVQDQASPYGWEDIKNTKYRWKDRRSLTMPGWQDVTVILTAQKYVGNGRVYALAIYLRQYDGENFRDSSSVYIADDDSDKAYFENISTFVDKLHGILTGIHDHNVNADDGERTNTLQGYVLDSYELKNLEEVLYDVLESNLDINAKEKTMELLFWIQGERLVSDSAEEPESESEFPVIVITAEIRKLLSLPVAVSYHLPEIISAMNVWIDNDKMFTKDEHKLFFEYISNVMKSDAIHEHWNRRTAGIKEKIEEHINKRLYSEAQILAKIQGEGRNEGHLVRNLSVFRLPGKINLDTELLRKWYFEIKLENLLAYHQLRGTRLQGVDIAHNTGDAFEMKIIDVQRQKNASGYDETTITLKNDNAADTFREEWFSAIMAGKDDVEELYRFDDYKNSDFWPKWRSFNNSIISIVNFLEFTRVANGLIVKGKISGKSYDKADIGKLVYIVPRYNDLNSSKIISELKRLDEGDGAALLFPQTLCKQIENDYSVKKDTILGYSRPDGRSFYGSQEKAFQHLYENRLTVLQGPPGTGKSDFIARSVITLCRFYHEIKQRQLRVLICANSHAAIENVLFMIDRKMGNDTDIGLYKASRFDEDGSAKQKGKVKVVSDSKTEPDNYVRIVRDNDPDRPVVLGATNWSCFKLKECAAEEGESIVFDLVIIDEASQVRVMDAMLALCRGNAEISRYMLVGDGDQLPAIIQGRYGKDSDNRYEYGSVFDFYREQIKGHDLMLCDCFRMNEILLRYSAEMIYGKDYHSIVELKHNRWLRYRSGITGTDELTDHILDGYTDSEKDYWPLVFCRISGATQFEQNNAEVMLASKLTAAIRDGVDYDPADDEMLWKGNSEKDGILGIVSPHHKHIQKLKDRICSDTGMARDTLYIGTVDKLQGQQREVVIVSYGVTDLESAVTEGEFIFNRNRLNVALTRAKCKSITIFSEILTKAAPGMLDTDDEDLQHGIEFVCGFGAFMQRTEEDTEIDHKQFTLQDEDCRGVVVDVYRKRIKEIEASEEKQ